MSLFLYSEEEEDEDFFQDDDDENMDEESKKYLKGSTPTVEKAKVMTFSYEVKKKKSNVNNGKNGAGGINNPSKTNNKKGRRKRKKNRKNKMNMNSSSDNNNNNNNNTTTSGNNFFGKKGSNKKGEKKIIFLGKDEALRRNLDMFYENEYEGKGLNKNQNSSLMKGVEEEGKKLTIDNIVIPYKISFELKVHVFEKMKFEDIINYDEMEQSDEDVEKQKEIVKILEENGNYKNKVLGVLNSSKVDFLVVTKNNKNEKADFYVIEYDIASNKFDKIKKINILSAINSKGNSNMEAKELKSFFQNQDVKVFSFGFNDFSYFGGEDYMIERTQNGSTKEPFFKSVKIKTYFENEKWIQAVENYSIVKYKNFLFYFGGNYKYHETKVASNQFVVIGQTYSYDNYSQPKINFSRFLDSCNRSLKKGYYSRHLLMTELSPCPRYNHSSCVVGDRIVIFGGYDKNNICLSDLWYFDVKKDTLKKKKSNNRWYEGNYENVKNKKFGTWVELTTPFGFNMVNLSGSVMFPLRENSLIIYGGMDSKGNTQNNMYLFDFEKTIWKVIVLQSSVNFLINGARILDKYINTRYIYDVITQKETGEKNFAFLKISGLNDIEKESNRFSYFEKIRKDRETADFRIIMKKDKTEIYCHKCILGARSKFFEDFLKNNENSEFYEESEFEFDIMQVYITFLYIGSIKIEKQNNIKQLLKIAEKYGKLNTIIEIIAKPTLQTFHRILKEIKEDFLKILDSGFCSDLKIICTRSEEEIKAHRIILFQSQFIQVCLSSGMVEEIEGKLIFKNLSVKGLREVLLYLYTGEIIGVNHETAIEIHIFSSLFDLPALKNKCRTLIKKQISEENVIVLMGLFLYYQDDEIVQSCQTFLKENTNVLSDIKYLSEITDNEEVLKILQVIKASQKYDMYKGSISKKKNERSKTK